MSNETQVVEQVRTVEGVQVTILSSMTALDYKDNMMEYRAKKANGQATYDELIYAARQYMAATRRDCKAKGLRVPPMKSIKLTW